MQGILKGEVSLYHWPPVLLVLQIKTKIVSSHTADYKSVKQEVSSTVILSSLVVFSDWSIKAGNAKGESITVPLTSCLTGLDKSVLQIKTKIVSCPTADSKPVKEEVNSTLILPSLVFPDWSVKVLPSKP